MNHRQPELENQGLHDALSAYVEGGTTLLVQEGVRLGVQAFESADSTAQGDSFVFSIGTGVRIAIILRVFAVDAVAH